MIFNYGRNNVEIKTKYFCLIDFNFKSFYRKLRKCGPGSFYLYAIHLWRRILSYQVWQSDHSLPAADNLTDEDGGDDED